MEKPIRKYKNNTKKDVMGDGSYFFRKGEEVFDLRCAFNDERVVLFMQNGRLDFNLTK